VFQVGYGTLRRCLAVPDHCPQPCLSGDQRTHVL
jgi:hypothetical protein